MSERCAQCGRDHGGEPHRTATVSEREAEAIRLERRLDEIREGMFEGKEPDDGDE
jgi:hypothetical protein